MFDVTLHVTHLMIKTTLSIFTKLSQKFHEDFTMLVHEIFKYIYTRYRQNDFIDFSSSMNSESVLVL